MVRRAVAYVGNTIVAAAFVAGLFSLATLAACMVLISAALLVGVCVVGLLR